MRRLIYLIVPLIIISCAEKKEDVLVKVDGSTLTKTEFEKYIPPSEYKRLSEARLEEFFDTWAEQEILYLEAKKQNIDKEDSVRLVLDQYKKNLLATELVRREFEGTSVAETEIIDYFDKHKDEFLYAVKLGQIVFSNFDRAMRTLEEIKAGADFFKLARDRSLTRFENPENPRVMTDYLQRGTFADFATEEIIFNMKPGEVSNVIPYVQNTWLIVKMVDKKKIKAKAEYDEYRDAIYNHLLSKKYQDFLVQYVDSLKTHYAITVDLAPLK